MSAATAFARDAERPKHRQFKTTKTKQADLRPSGPLQIVISIADQRLTLYSNGVPVAQAPVSTGRDTNPTPPGVFSIIQKRRYHISNLYDAPMPYMQRLTWSGVAMHAGPLPGYPASHGCIRLPRKFAEDLWRYTRIGARVIVARNDVEPVEIAHPRLFVPKPEATWLTPESTGAIGAVPPLRGSLVVTAASIDPTTASDALDAAGTKLVASKFVPSGFSDAELNQFNAAELPVPNGPVSVYVSRKTGKLYVRKGFEPLFEAPLVIRDPDRPFGTHVFTAMELTASAGMRWTAITLPDEPARNLKRRAKSEPHKKSTKRRKAERAAALAAREEPPTPGAVLDRIEFPPQVVARISGWLSPGASLIVSDGAYSNETGEYTDFIVLTR